MRYNAHYLVTANDELKSRAAQDQELSLLCDPLLLESSEGGLSADDYKLRAKMFVLLHYANEYMGVSSVARLFEGQDLTEQLFDKWWSLTMADDEERVPDFGSKFKVTRVAPHQVPATRSEGVNLWLQRVVDFQPKSGS